MKTTFITQPEISFGRLIESEISGRGPPDTMIIVSAFSSLTTVIRFKQHFASVRSNSGNARLILGVDLGGTSKEVLREVAGWGLPVHIVKNRVVGVTFHPKIYILAWSSYALVLVGSGNFTEGGLFRNYEAASKTVFDLPHDDAEFQEARQGLKRFIEPVGPTAMLLTVDYLASLLALPEIPSEAESRLRRGDQTAKKPQDNQPTNVFGIEKIQSPPKLPPELQELLLAARNNQVEAWKKASRAVSVKAKATKSPPAKIPQPLPLAELDPTSFYMTLPAMKANSDNIPGEPRIPLEARDMARSFWGWPDNYVKSVSPRIGIAAKEPRIYWNWKPRWRTYSTRTGDTFNSEVRMYFYENSSDFRFYAGDLIRLQAEAGDIVRLTRIDEPDTTFECALAPAGTAEFNEWQQYLVLRVKSGVSTRTFGYT